MPLFTIASALWGNTWGRLIAVGVLAFGFGFFKGFQSVPRVDVAAIERNAIAGRDAEWSRKLAEQERQSQAALDAAIEARDHAPDPVDATVASLCQHDRDCTDHGR